MRLAITRKVRDAMASAKDKQKQYADQNGRKNNERFSFGDKVLLNTSTLPKNAISVLPGGTMKLLPRFFFIGPFAVVEEVGALNYRVDLSPYMKTHPVFYVGCLKRYMDPQEITYPHRSNEADDDADHYSSVHAVEVTKGKDTLPTMRNPHSNLESAGDLPIEAREEKVVLDVDQSVPSSPTYLRAASAGHTPGKQSRARRATPRSIGLSYPRRPTTDYVQRRHAPAVERSKCGRRIGVRAQHTYWAPPVLTDVAENQRLLVGRLVSHSFVKRKAYIHVH